MGLRYKKDPLQTRAKRHNKKTEPGTRIASRLSLVRIVGVEPTRITSQEPKSCASANSAISAYLPAGSRLVYYIEILSEMQPSAVPAGFLYFIFR